MLALPAPSDTRTALHKKALRAAKRANPNLRMWSPVNAKPEPTWTYQVHNAPPNTKLFSVALVWSHTADSEELECTLALVLAPHKAVAIRRARLATFVKAPRFKKSVLVHSQAMTPENH